jgi:hypothetical protein
MPVLHAPAVGNDGNLVRAREENPNSITLTEVAAALQLTPRG